MPEDEPEVKAVGVEDVEMVADGVVETELDVDGGVVVKAVPDEEGSSSKTEDNLGFVELLAALFCSFCASATGNTTKSVNANDMRRFFIWITMTLVNFQRRARSGTQEE